MPAYEQFQYIQEMIDENQYLTVKDYSLHSSLEEKKIPEPNVHEGKLLQAILDERTATRYYSTEPVVDDDLKTILATMKKLDIKNWTAANKLNISINFSIIVRNVTNLQCPAIYDYVPQSNDFQLIYEIPENEDKNSWFLQKEFTASPAVVIVHGKMENALHHFKEHGYRHLMTRGGAAVHNAWLSSLTLGYAGSIFAGTLPKPLKKFTSIDGEKQVQLCAFSLGKNVELNE